MDISPAQRPEQLLARRRSRSPRSKQADSSLKNPYHRAVLIQCDLSPMQKWHRVSDHYECLRNSPLGNLNSQDKTSLYTFWKYLYGGWTWNTKVSDIEAEICNHMCTTFGFHVRSKQNIALIFQGRQRTFDVENTSQSIEDVLEEHFSGWRSLQFVGPIKKPHENDDAAFILEMQAHPYWCPDLPVNRYISRPEPPRGYQHQTKEDERENRRMEQCQAIGAAVVDSALAKYHR